MEKVFESECFACAMALVNLDLRERGRSGQEDAGTAAGLVFSGGNAGIRSGVLYAEYEERIVR